MINKQVATGDAWYSIVARQISDKILDKETGKTDKMASIFFAAYMLVVGVVMLNIVIAVLLDEFLTTMMKVR